MIQLIINLFIFLTLFSNYIYAEDIILVEEFLSNKLSIKLEDNCQIKFDYNKFQPDEILQDIKIITRNNDNNFKLAIRFLKNGIIDNKILSVNLLKLCDYPVFNKKMDKDVVINYEDIIFANHRYNNNPNIIRDPEILYGMTVKRPIMAGKLINNLDIIKPIIVKKGQRLNITYNKSNITIKITAIALENGAKGDIIKAKNERTDFIIYCEIGEDGNLILKN